MFEQFRKVTMVVFSLVFFSIFLYAEEEKKCTGLEENCLSLELEVNCTSKIKKIEEEPECSEDTQQSLVELLDKVEKE